MSKDKVIHPTNKSMGGNVAPTPKKATIESFTPSKEGMQPYNRSGSSKSK